MEWILAIALLVVGACSVLICLEEFFGKSVTIQTTTSRYNRESQRRIREHSENDSRDIGDLMKMSQELYELRPDRVLLKKLYEQTVEGALKWYVGSNAVFHCYVERGGKRVDFELKKYVDPTDNWCSDKLALKVWVILGTPVIRIERSYGRDEKLSLVDVTLVDLYDYLVEHYPLNPYITYGDRDFMYQSEEIALEKAADIIA